MTILTAFLNRFKPLRMMTPIVFLLRKSSIDKSISLSKSAISLKSLEFNVELLELSIFDFLVGIFDFLNELYENSKNHKLSHNRIIIRLVSGKVAMALTVSRMNL